jgi:hypothetical protein
MSDSSITLAAAVDTGAAADVSGEIKRDTRFAGADGDVAFFPEEAPKVPSTLPFVAPRPHRVSEHTKVTTSVVAPARSHNLLSISPSSILSTDASAGETSADESGADESGADENNPSAATRRRPRAMEVAVAVMSVIAVAEFGLLASGWNNRGPASAGPGAGNVAVESTPAGANIAINGQTRGATPAALSLSPGEYMMSVGSGDHVRNVRFVVSAGASTQRFFFEDADGRSSTLTAATPAPDTNTTAAGLGRGAATITPLQPAAAGAVVGAVGGWLAVDTPVDLELFERGTLIGSSQTDRIMLPVGRHVIELGNSTLGYKTSSTVQVSAGTVTRLKPEMPNGTLNINAIPWAEVTIDGKKLGPTPLGDVSLPIGSHEVVFTHPQLGERRQTAVVTLNGINRVSVNLNQR